MRERKRAVPSATGSVLSIACMDVFESEGNEEEGGQAPCYALTLTALIYHTGSFHITIWTVQGLHIHLVLANKLEKIKTMCCFRVREKVRAK